MGNKVGSSTPTVLLTNVCHISNKVTELYGVIAVNNPSLVIITESWLNSNIPDAAVTIGKYFNVYRRDRPIPGGGVLAYVNNHTQTTRLTNLEMDGKETLWLLLKPARTPRPYSSIVVVGVYYPPGQTVGDERDMYEHITKGLDSVLHDRPSAGIIIAGDFNQMRLTSLCNRFNLKKLVKAPTRGRNTLDQILTNMADFYNDVVHLPPIGRSDHHCLLLAPKVKHKIKPTSRKVRLIKYNNLMEMGLQLNIENWENVFRAKDVDDKVSAFTDTLICMLDKVMPKRTVRFHSSDKPWMTPRIKQEIKARQRAFTIGDTDRYRELCTKVATLISKAKANYYHQKAKDFRTSNPAKWYKLIYDLAAASNGNSLSQQPADDAENIAEHFQRIFTKPWQDIVPTKIPNVTEIGHQLRETNPPLPSIGQVKAILKHLNPTKATGIDQIPSWLLKRFCEELAPATHDIICSSIVQCKYPTQYKHALVSPVPKVYPPNDMENDFRQISILPQLAKILEKIQLQLNGADLKIKESQHAFKNDRSTVSALACITQNWYNRTDNSRDGGKGIHALFIDFRKAFDLVDHGILLTKLADMNVTRGFWLWTRNFLEGRSQQVKFGGAYSSIAPCPSGVPQGSVISPTLFNVHVNDLEDAIPEGLSVNTYKYADDCTQDEIIIPGSSSHMQELLDAMNEWADKNMMVLNPKKTKDMWICFKNTISEPPSLMIGNNKIERISCHKLLGVWIQENLKWNTHVEEITKKANKRLFYLRECRNAKLPSQVGLTCYETKIRPVLEYAAPVWGGLPQFLKDEIENIQIRSLKILGLPHNYLPSLAQRRVDSTIREYQKICSDVTHPCNEYIPNVATSNYDLRTIKYPDIMSRTKRHELSFIPRAISLSKLIKS